MSTTSVSQNEDLCTAEEYLNKYEPGVVDLMLDKAKALKEDERRAYAIATRLGQSCHWDDRGLATTEIVWQTLYPG